MAFENHLWVDVVVNPKSPRASFPPRVVEDNPFNTCHRIVIVVTCEDIQNLVWRRVLQVVVVRAVIWLPEK